MTVAVGSVRGGPGSFEKKRRVSQGFRAVRTPGGERFAAAGGGLLPSRRSEGRPPRAAGVARTVTVTVMRGRRTVLGLQFSALAVKQQRGGGGERNELPAPQVCSLTRMFRNFSRF